VSATTATCRTGEMQSVQAIDPAIMEAKCADASTVAGSSAAAEVSEEAQSAKEPLADPVAMEVPHVACSAVGDVAGETQPAEAQLAAAETPAAGPRAEDLAQPRASQDAPVGSYITVTPPDSPRALPRTESAGSFMALITDDVEAAAAATALDAAASAA
jgi:hypothetical protein